MTKMSFYTENKILTQYMVRWLSLVLMTPKTCDNFRQRDKQINDLKENI